MNRVLLFTCAAALTACSDPALNPTNSKGGPVDEAACAAVKADAIVILAKTEPTRLELQSLIQRSAETCVLWQHGDVVQPICKAYPDACIGQLEEELR